MGNQEMVDWEYGINWAHNTLTITGPETGLRRFMMSDEDFLHNYERQRRWVETEAHGEATRSFELQYVFEWASSAPIERIRNLSRVFPELLFHVDTDFDYGINGSRLNIDFAKGKPRYRRCPGSRYLGPKEPCAGNEARDDEMYHIAGRYWQICEEHGWRWCLGTGDFGLLDKQQPIADEEAAFAKLGEDYSEERGPFGGYTGRFIDVTRRDHDFWRDTQIRMRDRKPPS